MKPTDEGLPLAAKITSAALAGSTADLATFPLDTMKVWLMVKGESSRSASATKSSVIRSSQYAEAVAKKPISTADGVLKRLPNFSKNPVSNKPSIGKSSVRTTTTVSLYDLNSIAGYYAKKKPVLRAGNQAMAKGGALQTIKNNIQAKGVRSLYSGLNAGLQRQMGFCAVRIGFYDSVKQFYFDKIPGAPGSTMLAQRIMAGFTTGVMAVCLFQPTEVAKIQMQAERGRYKGPLEAYRHLHKIGGIRELWKGTGANCARTAVVNVCELVTYDIVKEAILKRKLMEDRLPCHFASALISGFITTVVASPVDVVKTRFMNSKKGVYKNPIQCASKMFKAEGFGAFYKGFTPSYLRLGSWNIVMFVSYEQYKNLFGGKSPKLAPISDPQSIPKYNPTVTQWSATDPSNPAYVAAIFHSIHEAGPIS